MPESGTQQRAVTIVENKALPIVTRSVDITSNNEAAGMATISAVGGKDVAATLDFAGTATYPSGAMP